MYMLVLKCFNKTKPIFKIYICWGFVFKLFFLKDPFCGSISYLTIIQVVSALLNTVGLCREGAAAKQWVPISQNHLSLLPNWLLKGQAHTDTHTHNCHAEQSHSPPLPFPKPACVTSAAHPASVAQGEEPESSASPGGRWSCCRCCLAGQQASKAPKSSFCLGVFLLRSDLLPTSAPDKNVWSIYLAPAEFKGYLLEQSFRFVGRLSTKYAFLSKEFNKSIRHLNFL